MTSTISSVEYLTRDEICKCEESVGLPPSVHEILLGETLTISALVLNGKHIEISRPTNLTSIKLVMLVEDICAESGCTKLCLVPRIIEHIKREGYLPALLSPCRYTLGAPYWSWVNRYEGDLVSVDVDASEHPHFETKWTVSMCPAIK